MRYEVYELRKRHSRAPWITSDVRDAIAHVRWSRTRVRVRQFYDRHLRVRVVQFIAGDGWAIR